ncbi:MAG: hypothetical protein M1276_04600 [Deltaproteobacteria bacterium]|jgi:acid phosphatase class B|nr:hypothetical protein [Deltaproteobacteria bacterium]
MKQFIYLIALMSILAFSVNASAYMPAYHQEQQGGVQPGSQQAATPPATPQYAPPQTNGNTVASPPSNAPSVNNPNAAKKINVGPAKIKIIKRVVSKAVNALTTKNYPKFIKTASSVFKRNVSVTKFDEVSSSLNNKFNLKSGYKIKYMVALEQAGMKIYLWKLMLKSGNVTYIKTIIKHNKIAGMAFV